MEEVMMARRRRRKANVERRDTGMITQVRMSFKVGGLVPYWK